MKGIIFTTLFLLLYASLNHCQAQRKIPKGNQRSAPEDFSYKNYTRSDTLEAVRAYYAENRKQIMNQSILASASLGVTALASSAFSPATAIVVLAIPSIIYLIRIAKYKEPKEEEEIRRYIEIGLLGSRTIKKIHLYLR